MRKLFVVVGMIGCLGLNTFAQIRKADNSADIHFAIPIPKRLMHNYTVANNSGKPTAIFRDQAILKLPKSYTKGGKPTRLIYCAHGAGGGVTAKNWFINNFAIVDSLLSHGYAIFDVNGGESMENMGGPLVIYSAFQAYKTIRKNYNIEPKIFVVGLSMGGLSSSNFCLQHPAIVSAQGLFSAVLDLKGQAWDHPWFPTTPKVISTVFDFTDKSGKTWEPAKVKGWNPLYANSRIRGKDTLLHYPVPVAIWHGNGDPVVPISASRTFQRYIQNGGGTCVLNEINSSDHGLSCGNPFMNQGLVTFFDRIK